MQKGTSTMSIEKHQASENLHFSPPMQQLVDEHTLIKKMVTLIPVIIDSLDVESEERVQMIYGVVDFISNYADKFHHAKEEFILFKYFGNDLEIIREMYDGHENARYHLRCLMAALTKKDEDAIAKHLHSYRDILTEHIQREDEVLYPWMDRKISTEDSKYLYARFNAADKQFENLPEKYNKIVEELEEKLKLKETN